MFSQPVQTSIKGIPCKLLEWEYPQARMAMRIWLVPSKGCMVNKMQVFHKGSLTKEWVADIREYDEGIFWWEDVRHREWARGILVQEKNAKIRSFQANAPLEDRLFTLEGLGVPLGTEVQDRKLGLRYRYGEFSGPEEDYVNSVVNDAGRQDLLEAAPCENGMAGAPFGDVERAMPGSDHEKPEPVGKRFPRTLLVAVSAVGTGIVLALVVIASRKRVLSWGSGEEQ